MVYEVFDSTYERTIMSENSVIQERDIFNLPVFADANIWSMWPPDKLNELAEDNLTEWEKESNKSIAIFNAMNRGIPLMPYGCKNNIVVRTNEQGNRLGFTAKCKKDSRIIFINPSSLDDYWDVSMFDIEEGNQSYFKRPISTKGLDEFVDLRDFDIEYSSPRKSTQPLDYIETDEDDEEIQGTGCVYFIYSPENNMVKIGTSDSAQRRYNTIKTMSPVPLIMIGSIEGSYEKESALHRKFNSSRQHGEWFLVDDVLNKFLCSLFGDGWK